MLTVRREGLFAVFSPILTFILKFFSASYQWIAVTLIGDLGLRAKWRKCRSSMGTIETSLFHFTRLTDLIEHAR
jgi:hypothetical protein